MLLSECQGDNYCDKSVAIDVKNSGNNSGDADVTSTKDEGQDTTTNEDAKKDTKVVGQPARLVHLVLLHSLCVTLHRIAPVTRAFYHPQGTIRFIHG